MCRALPPGERRILENAFMLTGKLVFAAGNFADYDIFLCDLSSNKVTQLTSDEYWNDYPRFSPDARQIAYATTRSGKQEVWVMNQDGTNARAITSGLKWADFPTWSPSGKEVAFVSNQNFQLDIFSIHLETGEMKRLTASQGFDCYPDWAPDGRHIAFCSDRGRNQDINILDVQTLEEKRITTHPGPDTSPAFSPDGKKIAFVSQRPDEKNGFRFMQSFWDFFYGDEHLDIWVIELATAKLRQMTTNRGVDRNVRWSPDGKHLAYTSAGANESDARIMICEFESGKTAPLRFNQQAVKSELERPFLAHLNDPLPPDAQFAEGKLDQILEKMGQKMLPVVERAEPGFLKKILERYQQSVVDRLFPVTARYLDWK
jgi:Tol biopolymer transport system component